MAGESQRGREGGRAPWEVGRGSARGREGVGQRRHSHSCRIKLCLIQDPNKVRTLSLVHLSLSLSYFVATISISLCLCYYFFLFLIETTELLAHSLNLTDCPACRCLTRSLWPLRFLKSGSWIRRPAQIQVLVLARDRILILVPDFGPPPDAHLSFCSARLWLRLWRLDLRMLLTCSSYPCGCRPQGWAAARPAEEGRPSPVCSLPDPAH